jgi:hypothetical protein
MSGTLSPSIFVHAANAPAHCEAADASQPMELAAD